MQSSNVSVSQGTSEVAKGQGAESGLHVAHFEIELSASRSQSLSRVQPSAPAR